MAAPDCPYCGTQTMLTTGRTIYPQHPKHHAKLYYMCVTCPSVYVGTHRATGQPLGIPANPLVRKARARLHAKFDKLWIDGNLSRTEAYAALAQQLGIPVEECHIAMFDEEMCKRARDAVPTIRLLG